MSVDNKLMDDPQGWNFAKLYRTAILPMSMRKKTRNNCNYEQELSGIQLEVYLHLVGDIAFDSLSSGAREYAHSLSEAIEEEQKRYDGAPQTYLENVFT